MAKREAGRAVVIDGSYGSDNVFSLRIFTTRGKPLSPGETDRLLNVISEYFHAIGFTAMKVGTYRRNRQGDEFRFQVVEKGEKWMPVEPVDLSKLRKPKRQPKTRRRL
ncbi:MAG: hypothetical protein QM765_47330 [Myxococcales bacterium]